MAYDSEEMARIDACLADTTLWANITPDKLDVAFDQFLVRLRGAERFFVGRRVRPCSVSMGDDVNLVWDGEFLVLHEWHREFNTYEWTLRRKRLIESFQEDMLSAIQYLPALLKRILESTPGSATDRA